MPDIERLQQLRRVVEAAPDERFTMSSFSVPVDCGGTPYQCSTAYCAAGWAAVDPWFRQNTDINLSLPVDEAGQINPVYNAEDVGLWTRLGRIFGIDYKDSDALFVADYDTSDPNAVSKKEVLDNIDRLIRGEHAVPYPGIKDDDDLDEDRDDDDDDFYDDKDDDFDDDLEDNEE